MKKESQVLQLLIGCFSIIGAIFTILGFIVAVLMVFYQQPIYVFLESVLPTPTAAASVVLQPTPTQIPTTPTPIAANEQTPPSGTTVPAGQPISKSGISIILQKSIKTTTYYDSPNFGLSFTIKNSSQEQKFISYKPSLFRVTDDQGNQYFPVIAPWDAQKEEYLNNIKQFTIAPGGSYVLESGPFWDEWDRPSTIPFFQGGIPPDAKFIIITIDKFAGMENLMWRYGLH